jgi:hypothetical protein
MPKRVDANQPEIVAALRQAGATVQHLHEVGRGCPDIMVGFRGQTFAIEIKTKHGKLNEREKCWHMWWRGQKAVVRTTEEALKVIGAIDDV